MKINKMCLALAFFCSMAVMGSCKQDNADYPASGTRAYISQNDTRSNRSANVVLDVTAASVVPLNVRLSSPSDVAQSYTFELDQVALDHYNEANGGSYRLYPSELVSFDKSTITLSAGQVVSDAVSMTIQPLTEELKTKGEQYAVALRLRPAEGASEVIPGADEMCYILKPVQVNSVPVLGTDGAYRKGSANLGEEETLNQFTIEMRVNMSGFPINNQAIFNGGAPGTEIYLRFGDAPIPFNKMNLKVGGAEVKASATSFSRNTWYHLAFVFDGTNFLFYVNGTLDSSLSSLAGKVFKLAKVVQVASAGPQYFPSKVMMQELRIWNIARSPEQLKEYEHSVGVSSPGLLHYWKMNEGSGREFKNSVEGKPSMFVVGSDGTTEMTPNWLGNVRSDDRGRTNFN